MNATNHTNPTIITNNVPRNCISWHELTPAEQHEFEYLETAAEQDYASFFRYRGNVYDFGEFLRIDPPSYWDGYLSDSFFSGILIRLVDDGDRVVVGMFIS